MDNLAVSLEKREQIEMFVYDLQNRICDTFVEIENSMGSAATFEHKKWERPGGGGGSMRIMRGKIFEKCGVNTSVVFGTVSQQMRALIPNFGEYFWASGISLVTHMLSPLVPTVHMNTRIICSNNCYWFGGGADLTPTIEYEDDIADFHNTFREVCENYSPGSYQKYKEECDKYFFIAHRNEPRGVGGIFYDYVCGPSFDQDFEFMQNVGEAFGNISKNSIPQDVCNMVSGAKICTACQTWSLCGVQFGV